MSIKLWLGVTGIKILIYYNKILILKSIQISSSLFLEVFMFIRVADRDWIAEININH
jgi:hypothetical protein